MPTISWFYGIAIRMYFLDHLLRSESSHNHAPSPPRAQHDRRGHAAEDFLISL
jgi:hypothetical protein